MAKYGFTLHSIVRGTTELPVSTVQEFTDEDHADMIRLGAIRPPTNDEMTLAGFGKQADEPTLFDQKPAKQSRKSKKDDEPVDPDVDDSIL